MEAEGTRAAYVPKKVCDAMPICERDPDGLQIVQLDCSPSRGVAIAVTTDGEIWAVGLPIGDDRGDRDDEDEEGEEELQEIELEGQWLNWTPTSLVTGVAFLGVNSSVAAVASEEGVLRLVDTATRQVQSLASPLVCLSSAINCIATSD